MRCHHCPEPAVLLPEHQGVRVGVCRAHVWAELRRLRRTAAVLATDLEATE